MPASDRRAACPGGYAEPMPVRGYAHAVTLATQYGHTDEGWWTFHAREFGSLMLDACADSVAMDAARARMADWRRRRAEIRGTNGS